MKLISFAVAAAGLAGLAATVYKWNEHKSEGNCECSCENKLTVTAHTGCMNTPDNTLESIRAGIEAGADIVEFDLRFSSEGKPVLAHTHAEDATVSLEQAFALLAEYPNIKANVDVKQTDYLEKVPVLADQYQVKNRIFFTGVGEDFVSAVREKCPDIPYYLNFNVSPFQSESESYASRVISAIAAAGAIGLNSHFVGACPALVKRIQKAGYPVSLWTANTPREMKRCLKMMPDNITTKRPDVLLNLAKKDRG